MSDFLRPEDQYSQASGNYDAVQMNDELMRQRFYAEAHDQYQMNQQRRWLSEVPDRVQTAAAVLGLLSIPLLYLVYHVF